jgi:formaldehyde-activating enzyme
MDAVRNGTIPKEKANDLGIIVSVWLNPSIITVDELDHEALFGIHREATRRALEKAMNHEPSIDYLLENQDKLVHKYYQKELDAKK